MMNILKNDTAVIFAAICSLNVFWMLNIAKEASAQFKNLLIFIPVYGPLLGLYTSALVVFVAVLLLAGRYLVLGEIGVRRLHRCYVICVLFFPIAVFPPFYSLFL